MTAYARADYTAALWEALEADREATSAQADSRGAVLALFPHTFTAAPQVPGFCVCGWTKKAEIHHGV